MGIIIIYNTVVLFKTIIHTFDIVNLEQFYFTTNLEKNKRFNPVTSLVPFALLYLAFMVIFLFE
jgi:hypothetical protein